MRKRFVLILMMMSLLECVTVHGETEVPSAQETSSAASEITEKVETAEEPDLPQPKGVDSLQDLLDISLDYFHSNCDYSVISDYCDLQAKLAVALIEEGYYDIEMPLADLMEKAALLYGSAEELQQKDPDLASKIMEGMELQEPATFVTDYMTNIRDNLRNGTITSKDSGYDRYTHMLEDWDKGTDYMLENYPEIRMTASAYGIVFGLEDAMEQVCFTAGMFNSSEGVLFNQYECEYKPENIYVNPNGICGYDMGSVVNGGEEVYASMLYYVKDGQYYLIDYDYMVGYLGG